MGKQLIMLRASYWAAAIADFVVAALVLVPERMGVTEFVYPMGLMSAVAFSWGVLLLIADRKPLERKWVLAPTLLVVFLLGVAVAHAGLTGLIPAGLMVSSLAGVLFILGLLAYTWFLTRSAGHESRP